MTRGFGVSRLKKSLLLADFTDGLVSFDHGYEWFVSLLCLVGLRVLDFCQFAIGY